jgi:hypothetical protein
VALKVPGSRLALFHVLPQAKLPLAAMVVAVVKLAATPPAASRTVRVSGRPLIGLVLSLRTVLARLTMSPMLAVVGATRVPLSARTATGTVALVPLAPLSSVALALRI